MVFVFSGNRIGSVEVDVVFINSIDDRVYVVEWGFVCNFFGFVVFGNLFIIGLV